MTKAYETILVGQDERVGTITLNRPTALNALNSQVMGEVTTAGQYPFINGMTVQNAIAVAGGFTPRGSQNGVDITRIVSGRPVTFAAPLNFPVRPGDTIAVRERFF